MIANFKQIMKANKFLSPTKIKSFLNCKYLIVNDFYKEEKGLKKKDITKTNEIRFKKGFEHEDNYFEDLKKKYKKTINLKNSKTSQEERYQETLKAMKDGYDVIRSGFFIDGDWIGETDFLIRTDKKKSNFGDYSYEVYDTKNTKKAKTEHVIQVGVYCIMLEKIQGVKPDEFHIVLKDFKIETIKLNNVYNYILFNKDRYQNFLKNDLDNTQPEKCSHCNICDWIEVCEKNWLEKDHLNQIVNINKVQIKKLNEAGIKTVSGLAEKPENFKVKGLNPEIFKRLNICAKLKKEYERTGKPQYHIIKENLKLQKGFNLLPKPSECDLFFDIESVQDHIVEGGLEYLFGFYYVEKGKAVFKPMWAHDHKEEKKNLEEFFKFTKEHFKKYPDAKIYHYAKYEITALRKLVARHDVCETEYDNYLRQSKFVDLLAIVKASFLVSESSYSIKNLEKFYNFKRTGEVQKGDVSEDFYAEWVSLKEKRLLQEIEDYNKQDCHSTYELREWLVNDLRPDECKWYEPDYKVSEKADERDRKFNTYKQKIKDENIKDQSLKKICSDIIGFYRRDLRPEWRMFFERKNMSNDELIEDSECIGDLNLLKEPELNKETKRSYFYTYQFPDQEYKIKKGDKVSLANNILVGSLSSSAGSVESLDQENKIIVLKKDSRSEKLGDKISIGKQEPMKVIDLEESVYKYIDTLFKGSTSNYSAIDDILKRTKPRLKKNKKETPIIKSYDFINEIPKAVLDLDNSYLIIQGPPGTGKTFYASNVIAELIKKKKKVAVSANSHKVIHNLLDRVEKICEEENIPIKGMKYTSSGREEDYYKGKFIKNITNNKIVEELINDEATYLYAGTKYHLCKKMYDKKLDYIFIDEAGQVSLSDVVVLGSIAKNIVLIGDQMQLPQPTQGEHPGESGKSVLEYILQGRDTIPEDEGVFLNRTYRLHPLINEFISETFYDNRLKFDPITEQRQIKFGKAQIQPAGIHFISANHADYSQRNEEEGKIVEKLYKEFIGLEFTNSNNKKRKLNVEDILTISPYNVQVNYLKSILKEEARVGTIDKFQGQQAPITIISMTSSDSENLPRAKGFFFNRNRLNVAISRAQLISVIIFNPNLLETPTRTIEEIYLLENFFKLMKYKTKFN